MKKIDMLKESFTTRTKSIVLLMSLSLTIACGQETSQPSDKTLDDSSSLSQQSLASSKAPSVSRESILSMARAAIGSSYVWGGTQWDPENKNWKGADCSGFAQKVLRLPKEMNPKESISRGRLTTASFIKQSAEWTTINRSELEPGDFLVRRKNGAGHIVIYDGEAPNGCIKTLEAKGKAYGILSTTKCNLSGYVSKKRNNLAQSEGTKPEPESPRAEDEAPSSSDLEVLASKLNCRVGPGTEYNVKLVLERGQRVRSFKKSGKWHQVMFDQQVCWASEGDNQQFLVAR
ncbi:MAG: C40 family peptidase [Pseudobacteriovorax sp.]|nr:C40 family peptidase [Pseudobacteriovorax sp.]